MKSFRLFFVLFLTTVNCIGQSYFVGCSNGDIFSLNLTECTSDYRGSTGIGFYDIAFTLDGRLWGISENKLFQIDTTNATTHLIGQIGFYPASLVGLNDNTLLFEDGLHLYSVNVSNLTTANHGYIGFSASGDLAWNNRKLYMTAGIKLVEISLSKNFSSVEQVNVVNSDSNIVFSSFGLLTRDFDVCSERIILFELDNSNNAIVVNSSYGTTNLLCSNLLPDSVIVNGAASIDDLQKISTLVIPNIFTPNGDLINDLFEIDFTQEIEKLEVFNRWGIKVFKGDSNNKSWDGRIQDFDCTEGVYYYHILTNECGDTRSQSGFVHLIR